MKRLAGVVVALSLVLGAAALAPTAQAASGTHKHAAHKTTKHKGTKPKTAKAKPTGVTASKPTAGSATLSAAQIAASHQVSFTPKAIHWAKCAGAELVRLDAECGYLSVPLDYAHPAGTKIKLAISRITHTGGAANYQGAMLVSPGGSGLDLSSLGRFVPNGAGNDYDWIGFDPRGAGASKPALTCDGGYFTPGRPNYAPRTQELETAWLKRSKAYAADCHTSAGAELLSHITTTDSAMDLDSLRKALGRSQISFYGFSSGTYLGQVYATLYPDRVRRMVLDGTVDPRDVWYRADLAQGLSYDRNLKDYFTWVARYDAVYHLGATEAVVQALYSSELTALAAKPAGGTIGPDEWTDVFRQTGTSVDSWESVADAFSGYVHKGDWKPLKTLYDQANPQGKGADNAFAVRLATQCTDVAWPKNWFKWRIDNWVSYANAPFETWDDAWFDAPCLSWPAKAGTPVAVNGSKAPPILMIDETIDAATPFAGSLYVRGLFPKAVLIEGVGGTTHAGSLSGVSCTDDRIAAYLATGALPARAAPAASDVQCPPVPQPIPTTSPAPTPAQTGVTATAAVRRQIQRLLAQR